MSIQSKFIKKIGISIIVALFSIAYSLPIQAEDMPVASFDKTTVDFGKFTEKNPKHEAVFTVTNTGDAPLIIVNVKASCGCTTASYTKAPIMPGKTGQVTVVYNGSNRAIGPFIKTVVVMTNAEKKQTRLHIKGDMQLESK